jgi:TPR repeat protein
MEKTLRWCLKVAERGGADDLAYVGMLYRSRNEPALAMDFFKRAIAAGSVRANHLVGDLYANGFGVPENTGMAMQCYEISAAGGLIMGEVRLLHLRRKQGGAFAILTFLARLPVLLAKAIFIGLRNPNDPRLVDMPKCRRSQGP